MSSRVDSGIPFRALEGLRGYVPAVLALLLVATSFYSYLLFHTLLELVTVVIASVAFAVTWQTYHPSRNQYVTLLGCGYLWVGAIDLLHTLTYRGMQVVPSITTANEPTQFWIAARYYEAVLLLAAPLFAARTLRRDLAFTLSAVPAVILVALVLAGAFPDCYLEGEGLTSFKIASEYVIIGLLVCAMAHLWRRRDALEPQMVRGILAANALTLAAEFTFTQYVSVYGPANLLGHVFKLIAFWSLYGVLVGTCIRPTPGGVAESPLVPVRRTYWYLAVASVVVPFLIFGIVARQDYESRLREAEREVARSAEIFYSHALNVFQTHELVARRVDDRLHGMTWDEIERSSAMRDYLARIRAELPQVQAIWLADRTGAIRNASEALPSTPVSVADRDYFLALQEHDAGTVVGERVQARVLSGWNINTARRRSGADGSFDGIIVLTVFTRYFTEVWAGSTPHPDALVSLVRTDGHFLARFPEIDREGLAIPSDAPLFTFLRSTDAGSYRAVSRTDGVDRVYAFRKLQRYPLVMIYGMSVSSALAPWRANTAINAVLFGVAALALVALVLLTQRSSMESEARERSAILEAQVRERTAALRDSEARFRAIADHSPDHLIVQDADLRYVYVMNPQLGLTERDMLGKTDRDFLGREDAEKLTALKMQVIRTAKPLNVETSLRSGSGELQWFEGTYVPRPGEGTQVDGLIGYFRNVTGRKQAQARMEELNRALEARSRELEKTNLRMEEVNQELAEANRELEAFSYSVSHDLRAPLRAIDGFSQALLEDYADKLDADGQDCLRRVRAGSQRMGQLIDDILQLSRATRATLEHESIDLSALARDIVAELRAAEPDRTVQIDIEDGLRAEGDSRLVRQVLQNLLGNAWKFTGKQAAARIEFGAATQEGRRIFFVRDNGAGFDMQYADKLFIPFQRLHAMEEFPGSGVGLAIVHRIVQRHGGKVWAEAQIGRGATFSFTLT